MTGIAVTPAGDVYATGTAIADSLRVGGITQDLANAGYAVWAARLNSAGVCQWLRTVDVRGAAPRIALDPSTGGVVVADAYQGQPTFGTTTLPAVNTGTGRSALFVARLSAAGQWTAVASSTGSPGVASNLALAVGVNGQVAVGGRELSGSMTFGTLSTAVPASNNAGFVIAQLSPANQWQWAIANGSSFDSEAFRLAYTAAGSLWVAGRATLGTVVGATTISSPLTSIPLGYGYHFLGQLSAGGQWTLTQQLPLSTAYVVAFSAFVVDGSGNAVVLEKLGSIGAGPAQLTVGNQTITAPAAGNQPFAAALSPGGQWRYIATTPLPAVAFGLEVADATLNDTNLYITGTLQGGVVFGNTTLVGSDNGSTTGFRGSDAFLAKLTNATALATKPASPTDQLAFFPNPAHAQVVLSPAVPEATSATLFDAQGREVRRQRIPAHATVTTLDLTGLTPGLYVVRCGTASGKLVVE
ncbi:T9SS type A sorting domain-containing protein [Hymenobacter sp. M29]|uniref:T9SS type A sorting domain-containing protein n=1 Tax=Hymenobacter mellowenesis TaxID=3063995 RepID=A0ABT9AGA8_9BACT|nr:T9SS type A sorting domain-containing protein [Hymenobacter sp. M29]